MTNEESSEREVLDAIDELRRDLEEDPDLVPTPPREAYELWLDSLSDRRESTLDSYQYRVEPFLDFLVENDVEDLNDLATRHIKQYEAERQGSRKRTSLNNELGTVKQFLTYCYELEAVTKGVVEAVNVPELTKDEWIREEKLVPGRANDILENLERYRYASREHVVMLLLWRTTLRLGAIHSLDVEDVYLDEADLDRLRTELLEDGHSKDVVEEILAQAELPFLYPRHRPESRTPLKLGEDGERVINIADWLADVLQDYIKVNRPDVVDDHGRNALLASKRGTNRLSRSGIRHIAYTATQPCEFGDPCPYDEDPESCVARTHGNEAQCPGARSPHKILKGSITWHRDKGWPVAELAEKANKSEDMIKSVYDQPEQLVRGAVRRQHLEKLDQHHDES